VASLYYAAGGLSLMGSAILVMVGLAAKAESGLRSLSVAGLIMLLVVPLACFAAAEGIHLLIDIEHNTRTTAELLSKLTVKQSRSPPSQ
jgi:hypothetical protein